MRIDIICKPESASRGDRALQNVRQALEEMGVQAEVHLFQDRRKMVDNRIYVSPALLVDDVVRIAGRVPEVREIKSFIAERPRYLQRMKDVA
ncbi:MAG: thioredoxin family protein [Deltaproteobacteria bacterium]|jgi:hypothetical protein|nr:thioredoxin family protein [Deltaproteobacteria bacterium]MBW2504989.1 thioredoxin family protein [Deltaproteobacteria bacterium]MBW2519670.1 thioredoxin family protein [Deltaproteobacteria bacterium]